jgi:hypothetical protein
LEESITRNVCANCFQKDPSFAASRRANRNLTDLIRTGKCNYCGEPPVSGSRFTSIVGPDQVHLYCAQCREDLKEFAETPENHSQVADNDFSSMSNEEFRAELSREADKCREIEACRREFMRMKVAQRRSGPM